MKKIKNKKFKNFLYKIVANDLKYKKYNYVHTRFAPEPNGYLHIGHAKSIILNFEIAKYFNGKCNLRFDDTNPETENFKYVESIKYDIRWLGFKWYENIKYTSDYFEKLYHYAIILINKNLAYVDNLNQNEIHDFRGSFTSPGKNSPYRNRDIQENIELFNKMKNGNIKEGQACLRAKINMSSKTMILRDPILYRIKFSKHYKTGNDWCIYPTYDFSHCISDALEGITHSFCTLEFIENRKLYNWLLKNLNFKFKPHQYEFSRLKMTYSILSKRKLNDLIKNKIVDNWHDPRILTISALRNKGYIAKSIRKFCHKISVSKQDNNLVENSLLEFCIRHDLNKCAKRVMAVLNPVKLIISNLPNKYEKIFSVLNHPNKPEMGKRYVPFSNEIYIDRADFCENNLDINYKRLSLGKKVKLRHAFIIKAFNIKKDKNNNIICIYCNCYPDSLNKKPLNNNKMYNIIHWVSILHAIPAKFYLYNNLFNIKDPDIIKDYKSLINKDSLKIKEGFIEPSIKNSKEKIFQFEREGYFFIKNKKLDKLIFYRTVNLINSFYKKKF